MIYGVVSDIHAHTWSLFASINSAGVNTRLQKILDELRRAAAEVKRQGGEDLVIAGDIFHTRGSIDPEVLNPVRSVIEEILNDGVNIHVIPGNHDLKSRDTDALSSAVENLARMTNAGGVLKVYNEPTLIDIGVKMAFVPWRSNTADLLMDLDKLARTTGFDEAHVFIHAGIDGVLNGMPDHGLTAKILQDFGFAKVFAGHYHNHKDLGGNVFSVGATTHQTWGDVGSRAGLLVVDGDKVTFHDTEAPKFVDVSGMDEDDMELEVAGNYARFRGPAMTQDQITELRDQLVKWGALGVSLQVPRAVMAARGPSTTSGMSLEKSIEGYIDAATLAPGVDRDEVKRRAAAVLIDAQAITEEA